VRNLRLLAVAAVATCVFAVGGAGSSAPAPFVVDFGFGFGSLDPALSGDYEGAGTILASTCAGLLRDEDTSYPENTVPVPDVAAGMPALSSDGLTYTFTVRGGFGFSGPTAEQVTPASFVRAFERDARVPGSVAAQFGEEVQGFKAYEDGTAQSISGLAVSGDQLSITLTRPDGSFLARLTQPGFCAVPAQSPDTAVTALPAAGPYYVDPGWTGADPLRLLRNPNYGGTRPASLPELDINLNVDEQTAIADVKAGRADAYLGVSPGARVSLGGYGTTEPQRYFESPLNEIWSLEMDDAGVLGAVDLRRAISFAIDRTKLAAFTGNVPFSNFLAPLNGGYQPAALFPLTPNLTQARKLMHADGYGLSHHLQLTMYYEEGNSVGLSRAQEVANELAPAYIDVAPVGVSAAVFENLAGETGWDLALSGWLDDYPDPYDSLEPLYGTSGTSNLAHFHEGSFDAELESANAAPQLLRYREFGNIASSLAFDEAPVAAYAYGIEADFFSQRARCETYNGQWGVDLTVLTDTDVSSACTYGPVASPTVQPTPTGSSPQAASVASTSAP
jgi:ABC-type oligopeptide transport system substrate-binding subunit